jgi:WD40 repeat protein
MLDKLCEVLTDLDFLQAKLGVLPGDDGPAPATVYDLLQDFLGCLDMLPATHPQRGMVEQVYRAIDRHAHTLHRDPHLLLQQLLIARNWTDTRWEVCLPAAIDRCPWALLRLLNRPPGMEESALLRTLRGHSDGVRSVSFSRDGLASGGDDGTVQLWDPRTGACLATLQGHSGRVNSVSYSPNGRCLASAGEDGTVRLWDAQTGDPRAILRGHSDWVRSLSFSPDGRYLATGGDDGAVRLWDMQADDPFAWVPCSARIVEVRFIGNSLLGIICVDDVVHRPVPCFFEIRRP